MSVGKCHDRLQWLVFFWHYRTVLASCNSQN